MKVCFVWPDTVYQNFKPKSLHVRHTFSGSHKPHHFPPSLPDSAHIYVTWDAPEAFEFTLPAPMFSAKCLSILFQNGPVENWLDFPGKYEWLIEFNSTLEGFNSFREVPPQTDSFHWTEALRDVPLRRRDPIWRSLCCPTCMHLRSAMQAHHWIFLPPSHCSYSFTYYLHLEWPPYFTFLVLSVSLFLQSPCSVINLPKRCQMIPTVTRTYLKIFHNFGLLSTQ